MNFNYFSGFGVRVKKVTKGRLDSILGVGLSDEHAWECQKTPKGILASSDTLLFDPDTDTCLFFCAMRQKRPEMKV